jgi:gas vesicle protein
MKENRRRGGIFRTVATFALGAAAGSLVALLYAPASGKVTRKRLAMRVRNLQRTAARRLGETKRALATRAEHVREAATEWIADPKPAARLVAVPPFVLL